MILATQSIADAYARTGSAAKALALLPQDGSFLSKKLKELLMTKLLGGDAGDSFCPSNNSNARELLWLMQFSIDEGADIGNTLRLFLERLEREEMMSNRLKAKTGSANALTYMGMSFFFPLFSGISSTILSNQDLFSTVSRTLPFRFLIVVAVYIPIILYLSESFSHPEKKAHERLLAILPYLVFSFATLFASSVYLPNIL